MSEIPDDPSCRVIQRAQEHMRARGGETINRDDVQRAQRDTGERLEVKQK
jgi:hypothetical protein